MKEIEMTWDEIFEQATPANVLKDIERTANGIKKTIAYLKGRNKPTVQAERMLQRLRDKYKAELIRQRLSTRPK